ncbi:uncharacterized protein [Euwallacea fornicatus]|uniref:uncharacterized protein n=1 Tax=Euwallacea fornicatus TaxID=995702 RepID=UPI00338F6CE4
MRHLPYDRVTPNAAFSITGVDYAGPFNIKDRKGRGYGTSKCYVAIFICFASRAIHLELVPDLTTESFIMSLRRFASRWGMPSVIRSDNGTNFVGANSELRELGQFLENEESHLTCALAKAQFNWKFILAYSPHFGGLWEAGVKSAKYHLKRVADNALLTFEELYTLLAQITAILNSRPLTPLSIDSLDLPPLTPSHLLIGWSFTAVPDPNILHLPERRLSSHQWIQQIQQNFWTSWSKEYISELQGRVKWRREGHNVREGALVLIKEDHSPPMQWQLGNISELHPGKDGVVQVVTLRTKKGTIRRAMARLCPFPSQAEEE